MGEHKANREYKDSVFCMYMRDKERLIEVYNAIQGTNYPKDTLIDINTLEDALYKERINDISFSLGGKYVVLIEHQSTINENMPIRMLIYLGRVYEKILDNENLYKENRIPLQAPEFIMVYNGEEDYPEESRMSLSESFIDKPHENSLELSIKVLNINYKKHGEVLKRSKSLREYSLFINEVRENRKKDKNLSDAIKEAVDYCKKNNIMQSFLTEHASEVRNMLLTEWNWDDALRVSKEEGKAEGKAEIAINLIEIGMGLPEIAKITGLSLEEVKALKDKR